MKMAFCFCDAETLRHRNLTSTTQTSYDYGSNKYRFNQSGSFQSVTGEQSNDNRGFLVKCC
jgi:hypothetical protein